MTYSTSIVNPYYAGRCKRITPAPRPEPASQRDRTPGLCQAATTPINASPVPHLTSLYHNAEQANTAIAPIPAIAAAT